MEDTLLNIGLAFLEGLGLIVSPCILPILPIVLSGSLEGNKNRPLGIIFGFVVTFAIFTFFSRKLVQYSGIDLSLVRDFSYVLLILFGLTMLSSYLTEKFGRLTQRFANIGANASAINNPQGGFMSGFIFGCLIGFIWTPCAGPILAAVIVQTVIQKTTFSSFLVIFAFGLGAGVPMLLIAIFGRALMAKLSFFKRTTNVLRKTLGLIILASVGLMIYNDKLTTGSIDTTTTKTLSHNTQNSLVDGLDKPFSAPAIDGITAWINSNPFQLNQLKGKVVLIDFWTYSCINCIRTLPYIKDWYAKYHDKGLVIIGVHTPEFEFEKNIDNVKKAVIKDGIEYPVALDSNFVTWQNYHNKYWPAHYLIDPNGNVVYQHFGEGDYDVTENNIRYLLGLNKTVRQVPIAATANHITSETYVGYARANRTNSPAHLVKDESNQYHFANVLPVNAWSLQGKWQIVAEHITSAEKNAAIKIHFSAKKVFIVLGNTTNKSIQVKLLLNGEAVVNEKGADVIDSSIVVPTHSLYHALDFSEVTTGILELIASEPGLEIYTFTFG
jgi:cytochrome c biogenesis protein CcdA/thiol-disulfide isomerase/thioredoxin